MKILVELDFHAEHYKDFLTEFEREVYAHKMTF